MRPDPGPTGTADGERNKKTRCIEMKNWIFAMMALLMIGASFAGLSVDSYSLTKSTYRPGEPGVATITVSNPTGSERVTAISMTINSPAELIVTSAPKLADIDAGGSAIVSIPFQVKPGTKPGIYLVNVVFSGYRSSGSAGSSVTSVNTVSVPVTVVNEPELTLSVDTKILTGVDEVTLKVENEGGIANNLKIALAGDVTLYGADQLFVGTVSDEADAVLLLDSRDAQNGPVDLMIILDYVDGLGISHEQEATLRMTVRKENLDLRFGQEGQVVTRQEGTLTLTLENAGTESLEDVRLIFSNSSLRLKGSNELRFGDIAPGASASASAQVYPELEPGLNLVPSTLSYVEKNVEKTESRDVPITISSDADVGVYLEAKPLPLMIGGEHTVSVQISNLGSYAIDNVAVEFGSDALASLDISNEQYIGSLNNDDFSTVQFKVRVDAEEEGDYPVTLKVTYRDRSGQWESKTVTKSVSVHAQSANGFDPTIPLLLAIGAGAVWWFKLRKKPQKA